MSQTVRPSRTAMLTAAYRARATRRERPICHDPWAEHLTGEEGFEVARNYDRALPATERWTAVRTRFIDETVHRALDGRRGIEQVVVLGAGLDSRAARLAREGVRFFEVDTAVSVEAKRAKLQALEGYPQGAATHVPCDFEREDFLDRLCEEGFDVGVPALFIMEGVIYYLTEEAARATLRRIATGPHPASLLVFDLFNKRTVERKQLDSSSDQAAQQLSDLGETLRFGINDPVALLYGEGYRHIESTTFDEACLRYTGEYDRAWKFRFQTLVVASPRRVSEVP